MTITKRVQKELVQAVAPADNQLLKTLHKSSRALRAAHKARSAAEKNKGKAWTAEEHERFLVALDVFPSGPWKAIADYVGTKDSRQTMTHAQKYRQKHERQQRGLRNKGKKKRRTTGAKTLQMKGEVKPEPLSDVAMDNEGLYSTEIVVAMETPGFSIAVTDVAISHVADDGEFSALPPAVTLVKQLSDSPRSADDGVVTINDPFAPEVTTDSLFALSLDANAAWLAAKSDGDLMEILTDFPSKTEAGQPMSNMEASSPKPATHKPLEGLSREKMEQFKQKAEKRGVVYIARVPPFMKPEKLRHLLGKYGELNRIYLVPEDKVLHKKRVSAGGNRRTNYTEGWIEFEDKKIAKRVAKMLNTTQIGGRKRDYYHDDMWNLKYLKGFKWDHLTEKIAYENRIRDQKLRMEIAQSKKENEAYLERVDQSKQFEKMEARKADKKQEKSGAGDTMQQMRRTFHQKTPTSSKQKQSLRDGKNGDGLLEKVFVASRKNKKQRVA
ncbi:hypothetical protein BBJ29_003838 [Phytophthora kernoviae]|uniref:RRM domain-containing protein n=1 Tax=Phytophthora kernoviae TaxID=325452 RepID=A0A3F2RHF0_9STRA|nr:hypothetical protein BBJ29_003838 [Phytophthora kernoviae]RLN57000.1 hypothetical protein BBP00_00007722 [Phytophthora kernoviae]